MYNANLPAHKSGSYEFWQGVVPGDDSSLISNNIIPWDSVPKILNPPTGWYVCLLLFFDVSFGTCFECKLFCARLQNCNDRPWTSSYPTILKADDFAPGFAAPLGVRNSKTGQDLTPRAQRSIRMLSSELPPKISLNDLKVRP